MIKDKKCHKHFGMVLLLIGSNGRVLRASNNYDLGSHKYLDFQIQVKSVFMRICEYGK